MPTRAEYAQVAKEILAPHLIDELSAWKGVYELLLWFDLGVPHIVEANDLREGSWRVRAEAVLAALAMEFACDPAELPHRVDRLIRSPIFDAPPQRQNALGIGFVESLCCALAHFSAEDFAFLPEEAIGKTVFKGVVNPPRSKTDVVVTEGGSEVAIISAKWSLRHDRLKDPKDECVFFKALKGGLKFYFVTNEFSPSRLRKMLDDYCIDAVFHINRRLVIEVAKVDGRLGNLRDLSELLTLFTQ